MALGKVGSELAQTLLEETSQETGEALLKKFPKKPRTKRIELDETPADIKQLDTPERVEETDKFFKQDKGEEFADVRKHDINREQAGAFRDADITQRQIEDVEFDKETMGRSLPDEALAEQEARLLQLQERKRDLYLKSDKLMKEKKAVEIYQKSRADGRSPYDSVNDQIVSTPGSGKEFNNVESLSNAIYNRVNSGLFDLKEGLRTKWLGFYQDKELAGEVIRYLKDGAIKNTRRIAEVEKIAKQWTDATELLRKIRNQSGARVGKLEDWIIPQSHDTHKLTKAGYKQWHDDIFEKLDVERIERQQGGNIEDILDSAYKNITQKKVETTSGRGSVLAKRGEDSRVLHFKDADSIIEYNGRYGNPDIFSTMDSHIRQQSHEIALLKKFGSNPEDTFNKLKELARADGMGDFKELPLNAGWRLSSGQADGDNMVDAMDRWIGAVSGTARAIQTSAKLGSATISSIADITSILLGSGYRGLNSVKILGRGLQTMLDEITTVGKVSKNIQLANRIGIVSEFASASLTNSRYAEIGSGSAQKAAEVVIRASGLGSYTNSLRAAVGLEFAGNMAENFNKQLRYTPFARLFKEYGITSKEWDIIRTSDIYKVQDGNFVGAEFFDNAKLYDIDEELGYKVNSMISNEMDAFVTMASNKTRVFSTWGHKKGSIMGESARQLMQFRSFPIAYSLVHINRFKNMDTALGKIGYSAALLTSSTIMGGITLWAYDTVRGNTVRDPQRPAMVGEALVKSGGLGVLEPLFSGFTENRYGQSWTATAVGVPAGMFEDIFRTIGDTINKPTDQKTWAKAYNRATGYIPGQNLWYTRTLLELTLGDIIGNMVDPDRAKKLRRREKSLRLRGQEPRFR